VTAQFGIAAQKIAFQKFRHFGHGLFRHLAVDKKPDFIACFDAQGYKRIRVL